VRPPARRRKEHAAPLRSLYADLDARLLAHLREEGFADDEIRLRRSIDMRYRRQVHILTVPVVDADEGQELDEAAVERTIDLFERLYEEKYGPESAYREAGIELVSFRVRGVGVVRKPDFRVEDPGDEDASEAVAATVSAWVDKAGELQDVPGYDFERLRPGHVVAGPAVVWTPITTLVVPLGQRARVDEYKNVVLTRS
jgi:N-methylhydantoinase A